MPNAVIRPDILYAWRGTSLLVLNTRGECGADQALAGYYFREARFLRTCRLTLDGEPPWLCEAAAVAPDRLDFTYTYPEVTDYGGGGSGQSGDDELRNGRGVPQRALNLHVTWQLTFGGLAITTVVDNCSREALDFELAWELDADFADIQEAQSSKRQQTAPVRRERDGESMRFRYEHEQLQYSTTVTAGLKACTTGEAVVAGLKACTTGEGVRASVHLGPREQFRLELRVTPSAPGFPLSEADVRARDEAFDQ